MGKNSTRITVLLYTLLLVSCNNKTTVKKLNTVHKGYTITGKTAIKDAAYIYIINSTTQKKDSFKIKNKTFSFNGEVKNPELFFIQLNNLSKKYPIVIENNTYDILIGDTNGMIIGGNLNTKLTKYQHIKNEFSQKKALLYESFKSKDINLRTYFNTIDSLRKIEKNNFKKFLVNNQSNLLSSIILEQQNLSSKQASQLKKLIDTVNNPRLINKLTNLSENLKNKEAAKKILRRKTAPLFTGVNLSGSKTSLANIMKNKKLFIIDFWASWCPPCRESSPKLIELYNTYHHKGFDILTVSEDRSVADWKNGIYVDDIEKWHHVYDDFNRISTMYNATALPHIVLIDENGKIIKNKISIKDLKK